MYSECGLVLDHSMSPVPREPASPPAVPERLNSSPAATGQMTPSLPCPRDPGKWCWWELTSLPEPFPPEGMKDDRNHQQMMGVTPSLLAPR